MFARSLLFNIGFYGWTTFLVLIGIPFLLMPVEIACTIPRMWAAGTLFLLRTICNIHMEVRGREYVTQTGVIYACKHQSAWETVVTWAVLRRAGFIIKRELLWIPLFGLLLKKSGCIGIDRSGGMSSLKKMIAQSAKHVGAGHPLVIYPEGTRTLPGAPPAYHSGVAALYTQLKVPVVPVALNSGKYWGKKAFIKTPGTIVMEFLPAIPPGLKNREFMARLESAIETASNKL